jgi:hypothetical protein
MFIHENFCLSESLACRGRVVLITYSYFIKKYLSNTLTMNKTQFLVFNEKLILAFQAKLTTFVPVRMFVGFKMESIVFHTTPIMFLKGS